MSKTIYLKVYDNQLEPGSLGYKTDTLTTTPRPDKTKRLLSDSDQPGVFVLSSVEASLEVRVSQW